MDRGAWDLLFACVESIRRTTPLYAVSRLLMSSPTWTSILVPDLCMQENQNPRRLSNFYYGLPFLPLGVVVAYKHHPTSRLISSPNLPVSTIFDNSLSESSLLGNV
ncbi:hypothetical protein K443DRAFT_313605 [Laccaria amethystina LaAM-08-1]|uniref:Uncharacterized protein n=1 Tax=Laccaria amethystina LaAM-08-1 TaxID=1095629 RepID=A0A0C9WK58_9AGAR|nr:hypothetical protein K443DRAFT_313605 [Laccaria amethystina LaAM-08-1]